MNFYTVLTLLLLSQMTMIRAKTLPVTKTYKIYVNNGLLVPITFANFVKSISTIVTPASGAVLAIDDGIQIGTLYGKQKFCFDLQIDTSLVNLCVATKDYEDLSKKTIYYICEVKANEDFIFYSTQRYLVDPYSAVCSQTSLRSSFTISIN